MALSVVAAGFTPGEADRLRRAMAAWKRSGDAIRRFERRFIDGMIVRGHSPAFAAQCFQMVSGFSGYGFPESHAASFALLVYASAWLKRHHGAAFAAALLNSQPMGFYQPAQIVRDAREHGVEVRPIDVSRSAWDCTLEPGERGPALRLGMRLVKGLGRADAERVARAAAERGPFRSIDALRRASGARAAALRRLAEADAFGSMGLDRRAALWAVRAVRDGPLPLFDGEPATDAADESATLLPPTPPDRAVRGDYASTGLSLKGHPVGFVRGALAALGVTPAAALADEEACPSGTQVSVAGLVLLRQRPATASGILFMTIEDETGTANLVVRPRVYDRCRAAARHARLLLAHGRIERKGRVVHVIAGRLESLDATLDTPEVRRREYH